MNTPTVENDGGQEDKVQPRPIDDDTPQGIDPAKPPQGTVDTPQKPKDDGDVVPAKPRDETIDSINDKIEAQRKQEQIDFMVETGQLTEEEAAAKLDVAEVVSAGAVVEPMPTDEPEVVAAAEVADDLDEFIVQDEETGELFFRVKVDGVERLLTADKAKAHLQKHEAADSRLQASSEQLKDLREREERLRTGESALRTRLDGLTHRSPSLPAGSDVDDQGLEAETREVVDGLFSGSEAEAAKKLAALLRKYRGNSPQVNTADIVARATKAAREQVTTENRRAEEATAYSSFEREYADIIADPKLFAMADGMTDGIQKEEPTWNPAQIMTEAGKRTRKLTAKASNAPPVPNDRQISKRKLRPMPNLRSSEVIPKTPEDVPETPASILAETRKFRGQPS